MNSKSIIFDDLNWLFYDFLNNFSEHKKQNQILPLKIVENIYNIKSKFKNVMSYLTDD